MESVSQFAELCPPWFSVAPLTFSHIANIFIAELLLSPTALCYTNLYFCKLCGVESIATAYTNKGLRVASVEFTKQTIAFQCLKLSNFICCNQKTKKIMLLNWGYHGSCMKHNEHQAKINKHQAPLESSEKHVLSIET